jgi:phosphoglycolate phosphatase
MSKISLIIADLDNTLFNWIHFHSFATKQAILKTAEITSISYEYLCEEYKAVLDEEDCIEYPFTIQKLPSVLDYYNNDLQSLLSECSEPAKDQFKFTAYPYLKPYPNVVKTLKLLKQKYPNTKLVVLSDAPHKMMLWRLFRLGLLNYFDGVYGLEDPKLPIVGNQVAVTQKTLLKHIDQWAYGYLGSHRPLPNNFRKPDPRGLATVLMDLELKIENEEILYIGDNVYKDIQLANSLGIPSILADYGLDIKPSALDILREFTPEKFIHKGINLSGPHPEPTYIVGNFSQLLNIVEDLC